MNELLSSTVLTPVMEAIDPATVVNIATAASLVDVGIGEWRARKTDKFASAAMIAANNAETGVASVHKDLLAGCAELSAVHKMTSKIRQYHQAHTLPWGMNNLLPTAWYPDYHRDITGMFAQWETKVSEFVAAYEWQVAQQTVLANKLGDMFDPSEYPPADTIRRKFHYRYGVFAVPTNDWRLQIGRESMDQLTEQFSNYVQDNVHTMFQSVWKRLYAYLERASERLDYVDHGDKKKFHDTLVSNVTDMFEVLDVCNVTGDSQMSAMKLKLEDAFYCVTPDALRDDAYMRKETKRKVDDIIASLPSLDI